MDAKLILAFAAVALVCFVVGALFARSRRRDGQMMLRPNIASPPASSAATPTGSPAASAAPEAITHEHVSVKFGGELLEMLSSGRREEVVRLVRERAGISEAEAETVVLKIETMMGRVKK